MGQPPDWCATYIILLDQCYTRSERRGVSPYTIKRHLLHMDHPLDLRCHLLQFVCSPFEVKEEGELIGEVVVEMVGEVVVEIMREVAVHLSQHCLLPYPPHPILTHHPILPQTYLSPDTFIPPPTYTSPSIPPHTYKSLPSLVSSEPASMTVDITLSSHHLSSLTLSPIDETMVDLVSELRALPVRRPCAPRIRRVLHPSAPSTPSAPSAPFEIARDPIYQLDVYARRHPKRNIKASSCETH